MLNLFNFYIIYIINTWIQWSFRGFLKNYVLFRIYPYLKYFPDVLDPFQVSLSKGICTSWVVKTLCYLLLIANYVNVYWIVFLSARCCGIGTNESYIFCITFFLFCSCIYRLSVCFWLLVKWPDLYRLGIDFWEIPLNVFSLYCELLDFMYY